MGEVPSKLSPREWEVLAALADGLTRKQVAEKLHISGHTVESHLATIFQKSGAQGNVVAVLRQYYDFVPKERGQ